MVDGKVLGATGSQGVRNATEGSWLGVWKPGSQGWVRAQRCPLTILASEGVEGGRGEHMLLCQEASAGASGRLALPQQPVHLGRCSRSPGGEDILDVSQVMNVGECHRHLWELTVHTGS